jgi:hypothetical protein
MTPEGGKSQPDICPFPLYFGGEISKLMKKEICEILIPKFESI